MTVRQYEFQRVLCKWASGNTLELPAYSTVQRTLFPFALAYLFPKSKKVYLPFKKSKKGKPALKRSRAVSIITVPTGSDTTRMAGAVRVVYPSEWAKIDVATSSIFDALYPDFDSPTRQEAPADSIETSNIVQGREEILDVTSCFFVGHGSKPHRARQGDVISVTVVDMLNSAKDVLQAMGGRYIVTDTNQTKLTFKLGGVWCVGGAGNATTSSTRAQENSHSLKDKSVIQALAVAPGINSNEAPDEDRVMPGDICGTLNVPGCDNENSRFVCILVSRFLKQRDGVSSFRLIWCRWNANKTRLHTWCTHTVVDSIMLAKRRREPPQSPQSTRGRDMELNHGYLDDGTRFVVYRILLYSDDFNPKKSLHDSQSAGGVYMMPLGLPQLLRRSRQSVRLISLTPPGISSNEVLLHIIPDLEDATKTGVDGMTPCGHRVKIFIDVVQYVADYPASSGTADVVGHQCNAPCTVCTIRRDTTGNKSSLGYSVKQHAMNSSSLRHAERQMALHDAKVGDDVCLRMGISSDLDEQQYPLVELHKALLNVRPGIPLTKAGRKVVSGLFDPYRSNAIAPDHLFNGLSKDILSVAFSCLPRSEGDEEVISLNTVEGMDISICQSLSENGLLKQGCVFDKHLHGMTLSELNCVIAVSVPLFAQVLDERDIIRRLLIHLQDLMALTYWWPVPEVDGENAAAYVSGERKEDYIDDLRERALMYIRMADELWKEDSGKGAVLDKPNLHRLSELYMHSIPAFGHVLHFMELVFESEHQPLKRCVEMSNFINAHLSAVEHVLGNDWQSRILALFQMSKIPGREGDLAKMCLVRFILGEAVVRYLQEEGSKEERAQLLAIIDTCFIPPVIAELEQDGKLGSFQTKYEYKWIGSDESKFEKLRCLGGRLSVTSAMEHATKQLHVLRPTFNCDEVIHWFATAKRVRVLTYGDSKELGRANGHDKITFGNVVQVVADSRERRRKIVDRLEHTSSDIALYAVLGFIKRSSEDVLWAVAIRCKTEASRGQRVLRISEHCRSADSLQLLQMGNNVRRVGLSHQCTTDGPCEIQVSERKVKHKRDVLDYGKYIFQTRKHGYPPRMA